MSLRRPSLPRHGRRALVASGLTAGLVLVPAIAQAAPDDPTAPLGEVTEVVEELTGELPGGGENPLEPGTEEPEATEPEGEGLEPPFTVPPELKDAFEQAGFSSACVDGVSAGLEQLGAGLAGLADVEQFVADLQAELEALGGIADPTALPAAIEALLSGPVPSEAGAPGPSEDVVGGLELTLTTLAEECVPTLPAGGGTGTPEPSTPPVSMPPHQPPAAAPAPHAPAPVTYPGYAPTGADTATAGDTSVPLTALAGGLVLAGAGAAGYGMRGRAVRARD